jgi:DNA polymerase III delta subunit
MLYLIIGDNKSEISNFVSKLKKEATSKSHSIHQFTKENKYTPIEIKDLINSTGMFSAGNSVFIYANKAENIDFDADFLNQIKTDSENDLFVVDDGVNKLTNVYKTIKKHATLKEFSKPRDYTNFNLSDAVFVEANKAKAITLIHKLTNLENEAPLVVGVLYMGLRNFASVKHNNKTGNQLHPYVKQKNASSRYNPADIKKVYLDLLELDVKLKTNSGSKRDLIDDFMLYSV